MIKTCHVCGKEKEHKSWKSTTCNECLEAGLKWCSTCETIKTISEFHTCRGKPLGMCKACECRRSVKSHTDNAYYDRPTVREKRRESSRLNKRAALADPDKCRRIYDRHNEVKRARYMHDAEFRQLTIEQSRLYRANVRNAGSLSSHDWQLTLQFFNNSCAYCGSSDDITQDHVIALSHGGSNTASNVVPCCRRCNSSKRDHDVVDWYSKQTFYSADNLRCILSYLQNRTEVEK